MSNLRGALALLTCVATVFLGGCGGGSSSPASATPTGNGSSPPGGGTTYYTVGGTVTGLSSGEAVTLQVNGADALSLSVNGSFSFSTTLAAGSTYAVTEQFQSSVGTCSISNGSGTIGSSNVTSVAVSCATIGGTVSGISGVEHVVLLDNGGDGLTVTKNGPFSFPTSLAVGNPYDVTVQSQTAGVTCSVNDGSGTASASDVTSVAVSCAANADTVLYSFQSADGDNPSAGLVIDSAGNLYGTTPGGGANDKGTVFELSAGGTETVLHSFGTGSDGQQPAASLLMDSAGNLYGTTGAGGADGGGTVFKVSAGGTETILYSFGGVAGDGSGPLGNLIMDTAGNLYGTTQYGGTDNDGTVFELSAGGTESVLHSFGGADGKYPYAGLVVDSAGNLYGTTIDGGAGGGGTVFKISSAGTEAVLYSFGGAGGLNPYAGLVMDSAGNLYGTTYNGGVYAQGTVFKVSAIGTETVLYSFGGIAADGQYPYAPLVMDSAGNLYGTTTGGGVFSDGTVFKIGTDGTETILHFFGAAADDGADPSAGLVIDGAGTLYGTTPIGGAYNVGTVFKIN